MQTVAIRVVFLLSVLFAFQVFGQTSSFISNLFATTQTGTGTYYGATTGGNCGYTTLIPSFVSSLTQVAIQSSDYAGNNLSEGCGMCIQMKGTGSGSGASPISTTPFIAFVQDQCPSCNTNGVDIALSGDGAWGITWIAVPCPVGSTKISYQLQGSNTFYLKLQVIGASIPVTGLSFVIGGKSYPATRTQDNFWLSSGAPTPFTFPMTVTLTAYNGVQLTDAVQTNGGFTSAVSLSGTGVQFSTSTTPTTPTTPTKPPTTPTIPPTTPTTPTKPPTAPTTPTKPPTAPTTPTTPTKPPTAPAPGGITCGNTGCTINSYWVEYTVPTSFTGTPPATAAVLCGTTTVTCNWYAAGSKYQCAPTAACTAPIPIFQNQQCPFSTPVAETTGQVAATGSNTLGTGEIIGIVFGVVLAVAITVGVIIKIRARKTEEYV